MFETLKEYLSKRLDLIKLEATEKSSLFMGIVAFLTVVMIAFSFFIILFNFGIAFLIGEALNNTSYGFLIVAAFYLILLIIIFTQKKKITHYIANSIIKFINH